LIKNRQLEIPRNFYHIQKLLEAHLPYDQVIYRLIFWAESGGCDMMQSEQFQGCMWLFQEVLIFLLLQPSGHFIQQLISFREEFIDAILDCLISLNIKFLA
jgi:hypothetical protein